MCADADADSALRARLHAFHLSKKPSGSASCQKCQPKTSESAVHYLACHTRLLHESRTIVRTGLPRTYSSCDKARTASATYNNYPPFIISIIEVDLCGCCYSPGVLAARVTTCMYHQVPFLLIPSSSREETQSRSLHLRLGNIHQNRALRLCATALVARNICYISCLKTSVSSNSIPSFPPTSCTRHLPISFVSIILSCQRALITIRGAVGEDCRGGDRRPDASCCLLFCRNQARNQPASLLVSLAELRL